MKRCERISQTRASKRPSNLQRSKSGNPAAMRCRTSRAFELPWTSNRRAFRRSPTRMDRDRHDFEVHEDHVVEIVPGVLLTIRDTNVGRQESAAGSILRTTAGWFT